MNSWLDTKYLGTLAKSAIAEAQKTLDKALDIRDEDKAETEDQFIETTTASIEPPGPVREAPSSMVKSFSNNLGVSNWGSFTGSFFGAAELGKDSDKEPNKRHRSRERKSSLVSSSSEPVSLRPSGSLLKLTSSKKPVNPDTENPTKTVQEPEMQPQECLSKMSSSIMEPANEEGLLVFSPALIQTSKGVETFEKSSPIPIVIEQVRPDPEGESESSLFIQSESTSRSAAEMFDLEKDELPESCNPILSGSAVLSSATLVDDSEELNSSLSSSQTIMTPLVSDEIDNFRLEISCGSDNTLVNQNDFKDSVITNSLLAEAMVDGLSLDGASVDEFSVDENVTQDAEPLQQQEENDFDDKLRPDSCAGSNSSKSFELLKMPSGKAGTSTGNGNGSGSGHTSGDDLETFTTTSSDIEVISSPGFSERSGGPGPSGGSPVGTSRRNRNEPTSNRHKKGHFRTCSEISSISCMSENCDSAEIDRLLKKITELSEILEARETKMVELSRSNLELQEQNVDLSSQVKEAMKINSKLTEANISSEEFTQRMANLEKKLQQTTAERDSLKEENKTLKKERLCPKEVGKQMAEKDEIISDLRAEGESLSKQSGKHSEIIKKLRSKEKSLEKELAVTKSSLEEKTKEWDRLKKSLSAKDDNELKQIDAIRELTSANSKWEEANAKIASDLEDAHEKANGLRVSLESTYKEIAELKRGLVEKEGEAREAQLQKEIEAREKMERQAREDQENFRQERDSLCREIDELRVALSAEERSAARREDEMRRERQELLQRLEQSEHRHEELSGSVSLATRPLLRQIESLQASLTETRTNCDRVEMSLTERLQQTSLQLAAAQERERIAADQYRQVSSKTAAMESQLQLLMTQKSELEARFEFESRKFRQNEEQRMKETAVAEALKKSFAEEISDLKKEKDILETGLDNEKTLMVSEQRKNVALVQQLKDRDKRIKDMQTELDLARGGFEPRFSEKSSPTPSLSQLSIGGSFSEHTWPDEVFDPFQGRNSVLMSGAIYESGRAAGGSMAALLESLQAQLKQREGEIVQLQMEVAGLERVKEGMTQELGRLSQQSDQLQQLQQEMKQLRNLYNENEQKYQTMLTMYGEKVEEAEELRLDLQDVKEMYKIQIEEVLRTRNLN